MHEHLKEHPEKAFILFTKVYIYYNNTKTPWSKLKQKQKDNKNFKWFVSKLFCLSKNPLTKKDVIEYWDNCPEFDTQKVTTNSKSVSIAHNWKVCTKDHIIYGWHPVKAYDVKVLLNTIGIGMCHFIEN